MPLPPNTRLGRYDIRTQVGAGGMGEVYLAEDTRLHRRVALKILPAELASDEVRMRRFEQEASATSALNHPNILTVYDIGTHDGSSFIVAELLEGEELRGRLRDGAIPQRKAVEYAQQIVAGLSAAHERGVVHRDLKPENIFVTADDRVKILDFGLAKLKPAALAGGVDTEAATRKPLTNPGVIMGTVGYMSPEQVRGAPADHRSDIFSFGVILYEMLSGRRPFAGDSVVETLNAILKDDAPELDGDGAAKVAPALDKIMRRCLEKKPEHRFHSAHDLGLALEVLSSPTSSSGSGLTAAASAAVAETTKPAWRGRIPWVVAGVCALVAVAALAYAFFNRPSLNEKAARLTFNPPPELSFNDTQAEWAVISPDGQQIVFSARADGRNRLYVRSLDSTEAKLLPGSDNPIEPFWSPDSRSVAFGSDGKLKRSDISSGGNAQVLCDAARMVGGTWSKEGVIVFAPDYQTTLAQVSAQGGEPKPVAMTAEGTDAERHRYPYFLPDGRHFLFSRENKGIWAGSLDSPEIKQLVPDVMTGYSPSVYAPQGYLIFVRNDALVAQAFDAARLALTGEPVPVITGQRNDLGNRRFSVSNGGTLLWQGLWQHEYQLVWFDREGRQTGTVDAPARVGTGQDPNISPDGKRLVVKREQNLWVIDLEKGTGQRITSTFAQHPVWSPDGTRLLYSSGNNGLTVKNANGSGEAEILRPGATFPRAWTPDGRFIIFARRGVKTRLDLYALPLFGERKEHLLLDSPFDEYQMKLSPDGRWLAYATDETGDYEIYVQSFSSDGKLGADKKRVSTNGGRLPVWRRDGSELFFVAPDGMLMSSSVKTGGAEFQFATPKPLFKTRMLTWFNNWHEYDVSPDGQRFLIGTLVGDTRAQPPTVILNWAAELKR
jgi:eukaryotic-like serine/threonine-protein kinase